MLTTVSTVLDGRFNSLLIKTQAIYNSDDDSFIQSLINVPNLLLDETSLSDIFVSFTRNQFFNTLVICVNTHLSVIELVQRRDQLITEKTLVQSLLCVIGFKIRTVKEYIEKLPEQSIKRGVTGNIV
jgi:hypothetical protein